jgi:hypothetical protein
MDLATKSRFRLPRFPSPSRRSPYAQMGKFGRELPSQDSGEKKDCKVIPDFSGITSETSQEVVKVELPPSLPLPQCPEPPEMTAEPVNATPTKKVRKVKRKKTKSPPVAKPIPAEIQELNEQVLKAVGSAQHRLDDDDTTGDATRSNAGTNTLGDSIDHDDLLSNINISTTSGIQVKGEKQKEEMLHQMIARRVLSVLIRPTIQETGNDASSGPLPAKTTNGASSADKNVGSALDDGLTDAADEVQYHYAESTNMRGDVTAATTTAASQKSTSTNTIREQLMALKAKTEHQEQLKALKAKKEHVSLKKKLEKSRKTRGSGKKGRSDDNTNNKKVKSTINTRSSSTRHDSNRREKASSYESFDDSFASKADAATCCFFGSLPLLCCCCADSSKSGDDLVSEAEDETTLYSDVTLDTYESGWGGGRPLPILSPSDFSAERDDLFDVIEKGLCGTI